MHYKIGMIGSGVVGAAVGKGFVHDGYEVQFFDINPERIKALKQEGLNATIELDEMVNNSNVFFICVPTPDKEEQIDLSYIIEVVKNLAVACATRTDYFVVVGKSTIVPGTTENEIIPTMEYYSGKKAGVDFGICFNPEFLNEAHPLDDVLNPDRIVIGELDIRSGDVLQDLFANSGCPIIHTDLKTAELIKYAHNCFNATKISYFNWLHMVCKDMGIDSVQVREVVQMDRYYATHPWEHGHAFGGKCLPKDLNALIAWAKEQGLPDPKLLEAVREINEEMKGKHGNLILKNLVE